MQPAEATRTLHEFGAADEERLAELARYGCVSLQAGVAMKRLARRAVLRGAGGIAIGLPFLDAMRPRQAHAQMVAPRRFVAMYTSNGTVPSMWRPAMLTPAANSDLPLSSAVL